MTWYLGDVQTDSNTSTLSARDPKESVRVATTASITLSGTQTIDGISVIAGNRVLVKDQSPGSANGLYVCASGSWTRALDSDTSEKITSGCSMYVEEGTVNGKTEWVLVTVNPITLGSTTLVFERSLEAGTGLTRTKNSLAVTLSSNEATATANTTTTSTSYVLMPDMTITPGAGTYLAVFSTSISNSASGVNTHISLFSNGAQIASSETVMNFFKANDIGDMACNKIITVTAGQAIAVYWKVDSGTGTARARVLSLVKLA